MSIPSFFASKDRASQLQLLLSSLDKNANGLFDPYIMYTYSNDQFAEGYQKVIKEFPNAVFDKETNPKDQFYSFLEANRGNIVCLYTDDCVFYKKTETTENEIQKFLSDSTINTFSFRLGLNTTCQDYVTNKWVSLPNDYQVIDNKFMKWNWRQYNRLHDSNFGFPNAFDSHIYPSDYLLWLSNNGDFSEIVLFEHMICHNGQDSLHNKDYMVSPLHSEVFVQQINSTHRYGFHTNNTWNVSTEQLNKNYIMGYKISLQSMNLSNINGCHQEIKFDYEI